MLLPKFGNHLKLFGIIKCPIKRSYASKPDAEECLDKPGMDETSAKPATHVIVNLDGVVLDTIKILQEGHDQFLSKWKKALNKQHRLAIMGRKSNDVGAYLSRELNLPIDGDVYANGVWQHHRDWFRNNNPKLIRGIELILCYLKTSNIPVALVTSCNSKMFEMKTKKYEHILDYFCHIVLGDDKEVKNGPPSTDLYITAAKRFQGAPKDMRKYVVFDSSITGIKTAQDAGMQTVLLPDKVIPESMYKADVVLHNLEKFNPSLFDWPPLPKAH